MRAWFDPTGLRTVVRNEFLLALFLVSTMIGTTVRKNRSILQDRLRLSAVAIDEERGCTFTAYAAYKFGRRTWLVTTFSEFENGPLWTVSSVGEVADPEDGRAPSGDYSRC